MPRSILTGFFVFFLASSSFTSASADESALVQKAPVAGSIVATAGNATAGNVTAAADATGETTTTTTDDAALPTAGADLLMWNAAPAQPLKAESSAATASGPHVNRLRRFAGGIVSRTSAIATSLTRSAMRFIGTPYVFGGTRPTGFDCSGYVQHVFALLGVHLPRTADAQFDAGHRIQAAIEPGDLVFFHTYAPGVSHVGIYLGHNRFIHSASTHGVSISSLHDSYWAPRYRGAKRVFGS